MRKSQPPWASHPKPAERKARIVNVCHRLCRKVVGETPIGELAAAQHEALADLLAFGINGTARLSSETGFLPGGLGIRFSLALGVPARVFGRA